MDGKLVVMDIPLIEKFSNPAPFVVTAALADVLTATEKAA